MGSTGTKGKGTTPTATEENPKITGFDFFSVLPDDIENEIEKNGSFEEFEK